MKKRKILAAFLAVSMCLGACAPKEEAAPATSAAAASGTQETTAGAEQAEPSHAEASRGE